MQVDRVCSLQNALQMANVHLHSQDGSWPSCLHSCTPGTSSIHAGRIPTPRAYLSSTWDHQRELGRLGQIDHQLQRLVDLLASLSTFSLHYPNYKISDCMTDCINPIVHLPHRVLLIAAQNIIMQNEQISGWNSQVSAHRPWSTLQVVSPSLDLIDSTMCALKDMISFCK